MSATSPSAWDSKRKLGVALVVFGAAVTIYLAYAGNSKDPPSAAFQGLLAFVAVVSQIGAAWTFSRVGVVDPSHLRGAVRRLGLLRVRSVEARRASEALADNPQMAVGDRRELLGALSVRISVIQEEITEAMDDWYAAMPHVANDVANELMSQEDGQ